MSQDDETQAMYGWAYVEDGDGKRLLIRFSESGDELDEAFTRPLRQAFDGSPDALKWLAEAEASGKPVPSLYLPKTDKLYLMHRAEYLRITLSTRTVDAGFPKTISAYWPGTKEAGYADAVDAGLWWSEELAYFFKGGQYARYNLKADKVDEGFPKSIPAYWGGMKEAGFDSGIDAALRSTDQKMYFFKGPQYLRYDIPADRADPGYPRKITDHWKAFARMNVRRVLSMWKAPRGAAVVPLAGGSENTAAQDGIVEQTLTMHPEGTWPYAAGEGVIRCIPLTADGTPKAENQWVTVNCSDLAAGAKGLVADPRGNVLYATSRGRDELLTIRLDPSGKPEGGAKGHTYTLKKTKNPGAIVVDAANNLVYVANEDNEAPLTSIRLDTKGAVDGSEQTVRWDSGPGPLHKGLTIHPNGKTVYLTDPRTGHVISVSRRKDGDIKVDPSGRWSVGGSPGPLTVHPNGQSLYYSDRIKNTLRWHQLSTDGTLEQKNDLLIDGTHESCKGMSVHCTGRKLYLDDGNGLVVIDLDVAGRRSGAVSKHPFPPSPRGTSS